MKTNLRRLGILLGSAALLGSSVLYAQTAHPFVIRGKVTQVDMKAQKIAVSNPQGVNYVVDLPENSKLQILAGKGHWLSQPTMDQLAKGDYVSVEVQPVHTEVALGR